MKADAAGGRPGDVMCYDDNDDLVLAVEVKGEELTLIELRATILKARSSNVTNILFVSPDVSATDIETIRDVVSGEFAQGSNVYQTSIRSLTYNSFTLLNESWRVTFLREICSELDARSSQPSDRTAFAALLTP